MTELPIPLGCRYELHLPCCQQKQLQSPQPPDLPLCYMIPEVDSLHSFLANLPIILAYVFTFPVRFFFCSAYDFIYYFLPIFTDIALLIDTFVNWIFGSVLCFGYGLILGLSGDAILSLIGLSSLVSPCSINFSSEALTPLCPLGAGALNTLCGILQAIGEVFGTLLAFFIYFTDAINFIICLVLNLGVQVCVWPFGCACLTIASLINDIANGLADHLNQMLDCPCALCIYNFGNSCACINPVLNICLGECGQCGVNISGCDPVPFSKAECYCNSDVFG